MNTRTKPAFELIRGDELKLGTTWYPIDRVYPSDHTGRIVVEIEHCARPIPTFDPAELVRFDNPRFYGPEQPINVGL